MDATVDNFFSRLQAYELLLEEDPSDSRDNLMIECEIELEKLTNEYQELFRRLPLDAHPRVWDALHHSEESYKYLIGHPNHSDAPIVVQYFHDLLTGRNPRLWQLTNWVGHGFGHDGTHASLSQIPSKSAQLERKSALVPGCGKGFDALALAMVCGYDVVGLDSSHYAIDNAWHYQNDIDALIRDLRRPDLENEADQKWTEWIKKNPRILKDAGRVDYIEGDFFSDDWLERAGTEKFDLIYDFRVSFSST